MEKTVTIAGNGLLALAFAEDRRTHPEVYDLSPEAILNADRIGRARAEATNRLNHPPKDSPEAEYHKLRNQLYDLREAAKNAEIFLNTKSAEVKHHESQVADLKKRAKDAADGDNPKLERMWIHQAAQAEVVLADAQDALYKAVKRNKEAVKNLKGFDHKRFDELKKQLFGGAK